MSKLPETARLPPMSSITFNLSSTPRRDEVHRNASQPSQQLASMRHHHPQWMSSNPASWSSKLTCFSGKYHILDYPPLVTPSFSVDDSGYQSSPSTNHLPSTIKKQQHNFSIDNLLSSDQGKISSRIDGTSTPLDLSCINRNCFDHPLDLTTRSPRMPPLLSPDASNTNDIIQTPSHQINYHDEGTSQFQNDLILTGRIGSLNPPRNIVKCHRSSFCNNHGDKSLICPHCEKSNFNSRSSFRLHLTTHTRLHRCQLCPKRFSRAWLLRLHLRSHTGERPYECPSCLRRFADRSNWSKHVKRCSSMKTTAAKNVPEVVDVKNPR